MLYLPLHICSSVVLQTMKLQRQLSMGKLSSAVKDILRLLSMAKCRELWEGLTVGAHRPADDGYFTGSYEFSCTTTPANVLTVNGRRRRRQRRLPPCIGAKQATEMLTATSVVTRRRRDGGWSPEPERPPQAMAALDIDGLAEEFIQRFREQLRMQVEGEEEARPPNGPSLAWRALYQ